MKRFIYFVLILIVTTGCSHSFISDPQLYYLKLHDKNLIGNDIFVDLKFNDVSEVGADPLKHRMLIESTLLYSKYFNRLTTDPAESFRLEVNILRIETTSACILLSQPKTTVVVKYKLFDKNKLIKERTISDNAVLFHEALNKTLVEFMDSITMK